MARKLGDALAFLVAFIVMFAGIAAALLPLVIVSLYSGNPILVVLGLIVSVTLLFVFLRYLNS